MDARAKTVREILHSGDQYLIPFFQRYYSWKRRHWERLRADVWALMEDEDVNSQHFLGPLVCTPTDHVPGEITPYQLIDGQQRLATLTLMLEVFRAYQNLQLAQDAVTIAEDNFNAARAHYDQVYLQWQEGLVNVTDLTSVLAEKDLAEMIRINSQFQVQITIATLLNAMGKSEIDYEEFTNDGQSEE